MARTWSKLPLLIITGSLFFAALGTAGCTASSANAIVGRWTTRLVGYNTSASGVTNYEQTVTFSKDGKIVLQTTLPGGSDGQEGTYEVVRTSDGQTIRIIWNGAPTTPLELGFQIQGDKLLTTRRQGTMPKPPNMNVTNADPVVYVRR
jgi:hypothetical protein